MRVSSFCVHSYMLASSIKKQKVAVLQCTKLDAVYSACVNALFVKEIWLCSQSVYYLALLELARINT